MDAKSTSYTRAEGIMKLRASLSAEARLTPIHLLKAYLSTPVETGHIISFHPLHPMRPSYMQVQQVIVLLLMYIIVLYYSRQMIADV